MIGSSEGRRKRRTKNIDAEFWSIEMADGASNTDFALLASQYSKAYTTHCGLRFQRIHDRTVIAIGCVWDGQVGLWKIQCDLQSQPTLCGVVSVDLDKMAFDVHVRRKPCPGSAPRGDF